ncbi:MAG: outer membrane lipoprotein carrier protein LolA, partial [Nitrospiraceae bacterium]|nr:outer membrane lipoprotein carrier protein LolA [Nitrospiraceae bacterium]
MRRRYKNLLVAAAFLLPWLFAMAGAALAADVNAGIARIQKAYESIKDLKGSFVQKSLIKDLDKTETYRGEFFIKPPLKMKWVYAGKNAQSLTIRDDTVLIYKK